MKKVLMTLTLLTLSHSAFASANKICFGLDQAKGTQFYASVGLKSITINPAGEVQEASLGGLTGTHSFINTVSGHDGNVYLQFDVAEADGGTGILVDEELHNSGTKGLIKLRWRGESFDEVRYFCRDL